MTSHDNCTGKNTGMLNLGKIRSNKSNNPIDVWKNEVCCHLCAQPLVDNSDIKYCFTIYKQNKSFEHFTRLNLAFSKNLATGNIVKLTCWQCARCD